MEVITHPSGLNISLDGSSKETPLNFDIVKGNQRVLSADRYMYRGDSIYTFSSWSDGTTDLDLTLIGGNLNSIIAEYEYLEEYIKGNGDGLNAKFYENIYFNEPYSATQIHETINEQADYASMFYGGQTDSFAIHWSGSILAPISGEYTISFEFDDLLTVELNGVKFIENESKNGNNKSFTINLKAGEKYNIDVWYTEFRYLATAKMFWKHKYQERQIVPKEFLYTEQGEIVSANFLDVQYQFAFPNPTNEYFNILYLDSNPAAVNIFDLKGALVEKHENIEKEGDSQYLRVDVKDISAGIYIYQIQSSSGISSGKFMKK